MNDADLERRFARLRPTDLPDGLFRRLQVAEPLPACPPAWPRWFSALFRPWPLAYAGLGATWLLILVFHLLTGSSLPPTAPDNTPVAQSSQSFPTLRLAGGFAVDRAALLTHNPLDSSLP